jgi:hypothetical protein
LSKDSGSEHHEGGALGLRRPPVREWGAWFWSKCGVTGDTWGGLGLVAQSTARLSQEFKQAVWAEQAAEKRVRNWG